MGFTVSQLLATISSRELTEWGIHFKLSVEEQDERSNRQKSQQEASQRMLDAKRNAKGQV